MGKFVVKNVNVVIVFLLFLTLGSLIVSSLYFQSRFNSISQDYIVTLENMKNATRSLDTYQNLYLEAIKNLNQTEQDVQQYDELFAEKSKSLEETSEKLGSAEDELKTTKSRLISTESDLETTRYNLNVKSEELDTTTKNLKKLQADHTALKVSYDQKVDKIKDLNDRVEDLEDDLASCNST